MKKKPLTLTLVDVSERDLSAEQIAALFTRLTGQPTTAKDVEDIKATLEENDD